MTAPPIRPDVEVLLRQGMPVKAIARQLRIRPDTVRQNRITLGIPARPATLHDAWASHTQPADDGHLEWTGARNSTGVPGLTYRGRWYSARVIAFRLHTGRDPVGQVKPECGQNWCVAPAHVEDRPGRQRIRAAMRAVLGMPPRPDVCPAGHDQRVHGLIDRRHIHYCDACDRTRKVEGAA